MTEIPVKVLPDPDPRVLVTFVVAGESEITLSVPQSQRVELVRMMKRCGIYERVLH